MAIYARYDRSRRAVLSLLLLSFGSGLLFAQNDSSSSGTISVDVNLVVLHATVRNRHGGFVGNLQKDNFKILEDGKPQTLQFFQHGDVPVSVGLIVDNSGSMVPKRADVMAAARAFVDASNSADQLFVVNFNEKPTLGLPAGEAFSSSVPELEQALAPPPGGRTALYDAIELGLDHLRQASHDKKFLIVVSDGGDNASHHTLNDVLRDAELSDVIIYTVGLFEEEDTDKNPKVLRRLAQATGGDVFLPDDSSKAVSICQGIAADIRHQYTLGYAPTNRKFDNTYRRVTVEATAPGGGKLQVRTREGYLAAAHP